MQYINDAFISNAALEERVQTSVRPIATEEHVVEPSRTADQPDITHIRTCAAVRTTGHSDAQAFTAKAERLQISLDLRQQGRKRALAFRDGKPTGRRGWAGHAIAAHPQSLRINL